MGHSFSKEYFPTIERTYRKVLQMEGEDCLLEIIDSSGDPIFSQVTEYQIRRRDDFVIILFCCGQFRFIRSGKRLYKESLSCQGYT